ncbi:MAG: hypothetical protein JW738_00655 [Actinobacteria bacterium]|nr:hypothetical protein [Actinomycetota bacterium]
MGGTWSNSIQLIKESFHVLREHGELIIFPVISGILSILMMAIIFVPAYFIVGSDGARAETNWVLYVFVFVFYLISSFIVIFFNTGLISCAQTALQGGDPDFRDGLRVAARNTGKIFFWALITATVGMFLRMLRERGGIIGSILAGIIDVAWNLITFFVIPVMIFQGETVIDSIKQSAGIFKRTWGENVVARFSIGLIFFLLALLGGIPIALAAFTGSAVVIVPVATVVVIYWLALAVISTSLNGILSTAIYDYATTGQVPSVYSPQTMTNLFAPKKTRGFGRRQA